MRKWVLLLTCSLVLLGRPCRADEEYDGARGGAKRVFELLKAKKGDELKEFAADPGVDPWLIVDALLEVKANDAAKAFAAAYAGRDAEALRAVAARGLNEPGDARRRLAEAEAKSAAPVPEDADPEAVAEAIVPMFKGGESIPEGVLRVRWLEARAAVLARASRFKEQAADLGRAAEIAMRAGWISRAIGLWQAAGNASAKDHDLRGALATWSRLPDLLDARGEHETEAEVLVNIAEIHGRFCETRLALVAIERALKDVPSTPVSVLSAMLRGRRGALVGAIGDLRVARAELTEAAKALETLRDPLSLADAYIDLGDVQREMGDFANARVSYRRALDAYESYDVSASTTEQEKRSAGIAAARASLATLLIEEGRFEEACEEFRTQLTAFQDVHDRAQAAKSLQAMAETRLRQAGVASDSKLRLRWLEEARANAKSAADGSRDANDPDGVLRANGNLGTAEEGLKHLDAAIRLYEDVIEEAGDRGIFDIVLEYSVALARVRLLRDNPSGAIDAVEKGLYCLTKTFGDLGDLTRVEVRARHAELFEYGMRAALAKDPAEGVPLFLRFLESGRAAALLDSLENRDVLRARRISPALERARLDAGRAVVERRAELADVGDDLKRQRAIEDRIAVAQAAYEQAVDAILQEARVGAHPLYTQPVTLADAQQGLGADEALALYVTLGADAYVMLVTRDAAIPIRLGAASEVSQLCRRTLVRDDDPDAAKVWSQAASVLWAPIEKRLPLTVSTVYVSPDGSLGLVPFPALPEVRAGEPRRSVLFIPSASVLRPLRANSASQAVGTLAVGIADYRALPSINGALVRGRGTLRNLDFAEIEARALGAGSVDSVLVGPDATVESVLTSIEWRAVPHVLYLGLIPVEFGPLGPWRALHFAVHGRTDPKSPSLASLALAPTRTSEGDLTAFEIFQHDLPASVAVLAACDSAGGGYVPGEGLVGLVRSFFFAGCPKVVASLWSANDEASRTFSLAFHKAWRAGASLPAAIETARAAVRKNPKWAHPYYWAGWCAWGATR